MKKALFLLLSALFLYSCKKEDRLLIPEYQAIAGVWETLAISYDSSGINISRPTSYNKLVIRNNLEYQVCRDFINPVENGTINIITQTTDRLEIFFEAVYPGYSSFAGSHIFGISNAVLVSLTSDKMIFKSAYPGSFTNLEFHFRKL
jgi:hypothetical protein